MDVRNISLKCEPRSSGPLLACARASSHLQGTQRTRAPCKNVLRSTRPCASVTDAVSGQKWPKSAPPQSGNVEKRNLRTCLYRSDHPWSLGSWSCPVLHPDLLHANTDRLEPDPWPSSALWLATPADRWGNHIHVTSFNAIRETVVITRVDS